MTLVTLRGHVIHGYRKARAVGFPTANLSLDENPAIKEGTYAGYAQIGDDSSRIPALVFYGRPHMIREVVEPRCEVHMLEETGDLYGATISIELVHFIRPNKKFLSEEKLSLAIRADYEKAKQFFKDRDS